MYQKHKCKKCHIERAVKNIDGSYGCLNCGKDITKQVLKVRKFVNRPLLSLFGHLWHYPIYISKKPNKKIYGKIATPTQKIRRKPDHR